MWIGLLGFVMMIFGLVMLIADLFKRKRNKKSVIVFVVGFVFLIAGVSLDENTMTNEAEVDGVQESEVVLTLEDKIRKSAETAFGDNLDKVELFDGTDGLKINVFAQVGDNLTNSLVRNGFNSSIVSFLESIDSEDYNDIFVKGYFDMVDTYGNVENKNIFNARILKIEASKVNYDNFDYDNLENISETYKWHNAFE